MIKEKRLKKRFQAMVSFTCLIVFFTASALSCEDEPTGDDRLSHLLHYTQPATKWTDALPIGNGSFGAMIFGDPVSDTIKLNHDTFWRGGPSDWNNPKAKEFFPLVKKALQEGNHDLADSLVRNMQGKDTEPYQPLADLAIHFPKGEVADYHRSLDISSAIYSQTYIKDGNSITSRAIASYPHDVIAYELKSEEEAGLSFEAVFSSIVLNKVFVEDEMLKIRCKTWSDSTWDREGMEAEVWLKIIPQGGELSFTDHSVQLKGADEALLLLTCGTSFNGRFKSPGYEGKDPAAGAKADMERVLPLSFGELNQAHKADYQAIYNRVSLDLAEADTLSLMDTDVRIDTYAETQDKTMVELLFNYGRYLLLSSSREGGQPAHLQGIWSKYIYPPWRSNYTININTEMNYWPAEVTNMSETT
ncbi:glycoside hydrolase family 95 protein [Reichenbachiella sp. ABR2-5]|uniref:Glycoside hydrolase family 95 protein n=1 Tax=Reichenbachiella ulvae TaxID=2980104 RepID=A0ABT3CNG2_9BACT|nr:glycoside hydrolase family 95 protein [Reichenbachiella ulvae]MCV9385096.1 glycoside hydrolase family 95 protein [Reichenbachiella ulvae]